MLDKNQAQLFNPDAVEVDPAAACHIKSFREFAGKQIKET